MTQTIIQENLHEGYEIYGDGTFGHKLIKHTGGKTGPVPDALKGSYTTSMFAKRAIDQHLNSLPKPKPKQEKSSRGKLILKPEG